MEFPEIPVNRFKNSEEVIQALNSHFRAVNLEKHPDVMAQLIFERSMEKTFKNYNREKISQKIEETCRDNIIKELRRYYGEWVNLYDFKIKRFMAQTNFECVYKTDLGRLFGHPPSTIHDHLFYTSHCFEQYRDRSNYVSSFPLLILAFKRTRNVEPTAADILKFWTLFAEDFCRTDKCIYVNVRNGVLVFERFSQGILVAKTFLLPDMDYPKKGWFRSSCRGLNLDPTSSAQKYCKEKGFTSIKKLEYHNDDLPYAHYSKTMEFQKKREFFQTT